MKLELTFDGGMKRLIFVSLLLILVLLLPHVHALRMLSDDHVSIDSPIDDDVFASGGTVTINAPVASAVIAGGTVIINAPVSGDVFVAGGQILVNSDIDGKIVAAGGDIDLRGAAENAVIAGGDIDIHSTTVINRDAVITGGNVSNAGRILGNLTVRADNFLNTGSAGSVDFEKTEGLRGLRNLINIFSILMTAGFLSSRGSSLS